MLFLDSPSVSVTDWVYFWLLSLLTLISQVWCLCVFCYGQSLLIILLKKKHSHTPHTFIGECDWAGLSSSPPPFSHVPQVCLCRFLSMASFTTYPYGRRDSSHTPLQRLPLTEKISSFKRLRSVSSHHFWTLSYIFIPTSEPWRSFFPLVSQVSKGVLQKHWCYKYWKMLLIKLATYLL